MKFLITPILKNICERLLLEFQVLTHIVFQSGNNIESITVVHNHYFLKKSHSFIQIQKTKTPLAQIQ